MEKRRPGWIDVYPINGRNLNILNVGVRPSFTRDLEKFIAEEWKPKAEAGWTSSWVAFARSAAFGEDIRIDAGAMQFHQIHGMNRALEEKKPFAPKTGFIPCLSVGFITATSDGNVILQRRGPDVHVPNTLINEPTGYMASMMFAPISECANPSYANDQKLFDVIVQLEARKQHIANNFNIDAHLVSYEPKQDILGAGWLSTEMYFSTTGKIDAEARHLEPPKNTEILFVPFGELKALILNQGRLANVDRAHHRPDDVKEIPLIDETLLGLIYGYKHLTGDNSLDPEETIDRLNHEGLDIRVYDTSQGKQYEFPTSF